MKYLFPSQLETAVRVDKPIEQFIEEFYENGFKAIKWISINLNAGYYHLYLHEVFDDSEEGISSIYDFSYVEPDDMYGKLIFKSTSFSDVLTLAEESFNANNHRYLNFGFMDEALRVTKE